jgi:hypothetical protein
MTRAKEKIASAYRFCGADVKLKEDPGKGHVGMFSQGPMGLHIRDGEHAFDPRDLDLMLDFADERLKRCSAESDGQEKGKSLLGRGGLPMEKKNGE